ncbi:MAG: hypothetical protein R2878_04725 [Thermoleophilia bacterium]
MPRYLLSSHDGFGLGHTRRNGLIAMALLDADPDAAVTLVTGLDPDRAGLRHPRLNIIPVPPLVKDEHGDYRSGTMSVRDAVGRRAAVFNEVVSGWHPDVIVVDRHPYGTFGELRHGLLRARLRGAALVLGLRDVLDEPVAVAAEVHGGAWEGVPEVYTDVLVYGDPAVCDHEAEYGLPMTPRYCGWVVGPPAPQAPEPGLLLIAAGGGGDGGPVYALGASVLRQRGDWRGIVLAGPYAATEDHEHERLHFVRGAHDVETYLARSAAVIQMAGYNSTVEALAAGLRPILLPRRSPRREQAIRALRLAKLGLADVVDPDADVSEVTWLLDRPRRLAPGAAAAAGIGFDGADRAAAHIAACCMETAR